MAPLRRSERLKRKHAAAAEKVLLDEEHFSTRQKKRREIFRRSPSDITTAVPSMISGLWSDDSKLQLDATSQLFQLLANGDQPPIDEVIQSGAVPRLVEFIMRNDYPQLQCEAARVLKNITSGTSENTKTVIDCEAVPVLVKLLDSYNLEMLEQAAWALGNIAGDSTGFRDVVLNSGALRLLLTRLNDKKELSFLRIGTWALSNFFEGELEPPFEQLESAIPILASLIDTNDAQVLKETCWALAYLSRCGGGLKSAIIEAGVWLKLAEVIQHPSPSVVFPAIRTIESIVSGIDPMEVGRELPKEETSHYFFEMEPLAVTLRLSAMIDRKMFNTCIETEARNILSSFNHRVQEICCGMWKQDDTGI